MKKIVLLPKTDTVTLCLPEEWVGVPVICKLEPIKNSFMNNNEMIIETERIITVRHKKRRKNDENMLE